MKPIPIQGSFLSVQLQLTQPPTSRIELLIYKQDSVIYNATIIDFEEVQDDLPFILEENGVNLPANRLNQILDELEGEYLDLVEKQSKIKKEQTERHRKVTSLINPTENSQTRHKKILIMGLESVGKSSIYQVIFEGKLPHETQTLAPTRGVERHSMVFQSIGKDTNEKETKNIVENAFNADNQNSNSFGSSSNSISNNSISNSHIKSNKIFSSSDLSKNSKEDGLTLNYQSNIFLKKPESGDELYIWDLGGQEGFWERYLKKPDLFFDQAACLLFVIDAFNPQQFEKARELFHESIELFMKYRDPSLKWQIKPPIFCFIHKMDHYSNPEEQFNYLVPYFRKNPKTGEQNFDISFYSTSIYDSSIYSGWIKVIQTILPKSSRLNMLAQELKEDLNLYAVFVIEKRTGLPICSSKTLLDDAALVGSANRIIITVEKVLPEFELANLEKFEIDTGNGILEIRIFDKYYLLVLLYPTTSNVCDVDGEERINKFIDAMKTNI